MGTPKAQHEVLGRAEVSVARRFSEAVSTIATRGPNTQRGPQKLSMRFWGERRSRSPVDLAKQYRPLRPEDRTRKGALAHLVERFVRNEEVGSSSLLCSTNRTNNVWSPVETAFFAVSHHIATCRTNFYESTLSCSLVHPYFYLSCYRSVYTPTFPPTSPVLLLALIRQVKICRETLEL